MYDNNIRTLPSKREWTLRKNEESNNIK